MTGNAIEPKDKAKELYDQMKGFRVTNKHRKKCARVAAEHLLGLEKEFACGNPREYYLYEEVLTEIEKL
jgi:hypothetical protein